MMAFESEDQAEEFLKSRGWTTPVYGVWRVPDREIPAEESDAMDYLWLEWDHCTAPEEASDD
jgi:hypothetical protein